jgi:hypothetical protein
MRMRKGILLAGALLLAAPAQAQDLRQQAGLTLVKLFVVSGRPTALVNVLNTTKVPLDIEVVCTFMKGDAVTTKGFGQITVLPNKTLPLEVRGQQAQPFERANCGIESAKP